MRAVFLSPPPLWGVGVVCIGYGAIILAGVFFLNLELYLDVLKAGPTSADPSGSSGSSKCSKDVALTFDDGPDPDTTPRVLEMLARANVHATFFMIGRKAEAHPELVRQVIAGGHSIGVHGYSHDRFLSLRSKAVVRRDLERAVVVLTELSGKRVHLFRPPIGFSNPRIAEVANELGLQTIGYTLRAYDGVRSRGESRARRLLVQRIRKGAIVLLHDASENGDFVPATIQLLPALLTKLEREGYRGVTVDAWAHAKFAGRAPRA